MNQNVHNFYVRVEDYVLLFLSSLEVFINHFFKYLLIFVWGSFGSSLLCAGYLHREQGLPLVAARWHRTEVASLVAELRPDSTGSVAATHGLSYSTTCGIFLDQGWNPCPLHWQADSLPLDHQGSLIIHFVFNLFGKRKKIWKSLWKTSRNFFQQIQCGSYNRFYHIGRDL